MKKVTFLERLRFWLFLKLGEHLWEFVIFHTDHWKRPYGMSFTSEKDWLQRVNYDMKGVTNLQEEIGKESTDGNCYCK